MQAAVSLFWFSLLIWGLVGLASPAVARLRNRWRALIPLTASVPLVGLLMITGIAEQPAVPDAGIALIVMWAGIIALCFLVPRSRRKVTPTNVLPKEEQVVPDRTPEQVDEIRRDARRRVLLRDAPPLPSPPPRKSPDAFGDADEYYEGLREQDRNDGRWGDGEWGERASFDYIDYHGHPSHRRVVNWKSIGPHITGYCLDRKASRTFRKGRIRNWSGY